ncbi:hypothetical protein C0033_25985 [Clostridium sp. chh4-2]|uniref:hypothetical protein n=1 Tax=Clostridium sp. chh4-2 TaxID=2067550 RepID=UPI000CCFB522|nr:hypothetical protein [Clostridium sp. chh4-2]PNV59044.1 hypothetical protein C0033_25985 [Clostridium sp. chh4-2]
MAFMGGDKNGGIVHRKMWIVWISKKSNIDFVQFARLTIIGGKGREIMTEKVNFLLIKRENVE